MGKTKIKILDDSQIEPEKTAKKPEKRDELVEKLKHELGIENRPKDDQPLAETELSVLSVLGETRVHNFFLD